MRKRYRLVFSPGKGLSARVVYPTDPVAEAFWRPRLEAAGSAAERLRAHIASNLELLRAHPRQVRPLAEIFAARGEDGRRVVGPAHHRDAGGPPGGGPA